MRKVLSIVFLSGLMFLSVTSCNQQEKKNADGTPVVQDISAQELNAIENEVLLIDVRTPREYQSGHLKNAINIDYSSSDFKSKIAELPKDQEIYLYCKSGMRSSRAARQFEKMGFKKVYDLEGGLLSWQRNQYPLVK